MSFRITGLPAEDFAHLFALSDVELMARGAVRRIADGRMPGTPCRVSLTDSQPGDELLLVNYEHHPVDSPYRMRFAIYVRKGEETYDAVDRVPEQLRLRTLAVRAFDANAMMVGKGARRRGRVGGRDRAALCRPERFLPAYSLCGAWLLRGTGRADLSGCKDLHDASLGPVRRDSLGPPVSATSAAPAGRRSAAPVFPRLAAADFP
jgi:hypothetical protein